MHTQIRGRARSAQPEKRKELDEKAMSGRARSSKNVTSAALCRGNWPEWRYRLARKPVQALDKRVFIVVIPFFGVGIR